MGGPWSPANFEGGWRRPEDVRRTGGGRERPLWDQLRACASDRVLRYTRVTAEMALWYVPRRPQGSHLGGMSHVYTSGVLTWGGREWTRSYAARDLLNVPANGHIVATFIVVSEMYLTVT